MQTGPIETTGVREKIGWRTHLERLRRISAADVRQLLSMTVNNWFLHNVPRLGASLAFYTMLSLAPLLIVVIAIASLAFGREAATGRLVWQIQDLVGRPGAEAIQAIIQGAQRQQTGVIATVLGLLTLLYGATSVVAELRSALNTIWCVRVSEQTGLQSILEVLRERTISFALVLGVGFLLVVSLAVNAALAAVGPRIHSYLPTPEWLLHVADFGITWIVIGSLFAVIYKYLPDLYLEWLDVLPGAVATSLLFSLGKIVIGVYIGKAGVASAYGAAGSLVVVLLWVYYSAQIFFFGAEFTQAWAQTFGSRPCGRAAVQVEITGPESPESHPLPTLR